MNKVVKIVIVVLAGATILSNLGYNTTTVVAGVGVGGLAVALAAQETIENLFGGVSLESAFTWKRIRTETLEEAFKEKAF